MAINIRYMALQKAINTLTTSGNDVGALSPYLLHPKLITFIERGGLATMLKNLKLFNTSQTDETFVLPQKSCKKLKGTVFTRLGENSRLLLGFSSMAFNDYKVNDQIENQWSELAGKAVNNEQKVLVSWLKDRCPRNIKPANLDTKTAQKEKCIDKNIRELYIIQSNIKIKKEDLNFLGLREP